MENAEILVYITTKNEEEALKIGKKLVELKLAACSNIFPQIKSFYWWENELCEEQEACLIVKTVENLLPEVTNQVKQLHSYSVPAIIAFRAAGGNEEFLKWISSSVMPPVQKQAEETI